MGKNKRNKRNRDREVAMSSLERFLRIPETPPISELGQANEAVRTAEAALLKARRRAAIAAHESRDRGLGPDYQRARKRVLDRAAEPCTVPGDPVSLETTEPGEDLASAFFNRAGDYFLAKFTITTDPDADASIAPTATAETVLKADEAQFPYLLEVLRQIRGGFGTRCRVELYRTHTVEQGPAADHEPPPPGRVVITEENLEEAAASIGLTGEELVKLSPGEVLRHLAEAGREPDDPAASFRKRVNPKTASGPANVNPLVGYTAGGIIENGQWDDPKTASGPGDANEQVAAVDPEQIENGQSATDRLIARLAEAVADGRLTPEQADRYRAEAGLAPWPVDDGGTSSVGLFQQQPPRWHVSEGSWELKGNPGDLVQPPEDGPPIPMSEFTVGPRQRGPEVVGADGLTDSERAGQIPPWLSGIPLGLPDDALGDLVEETPIELTREEIQAQLPGMTRAEAAAELGKRADELGGNIYSTGDLEVDQIARELGIPVESLQKIPMAGGGYAYSVIPTPPPEPEGRHSAPDPEPEVDWSQLAANAWQGAGQYRMPANRGPGYTHLCRTIDELELELRANGVPAPGAWLVARSR
jgi:hypothetical protein